MKRVTHVRPVSQELAVASTTLQSKMNLGMDLLERIVVLPRAKAWGIWFPNQNGETGTTDTGGGLGGGGVGDGGGGDGGL